MRQSERLGTILALHIGFFLAVFQIKTYITYPLSSAARRTHGNLALRPSRWAPYLLRLCSSMLRYQMEEKGFVLTCLKIGCLSPSQDRRVAPGKCLSTSTKTHRPRVQEDCHGLGGKAPHQFLNFLYVFRKLVTVSGRSCHDYVLDTISEDCGRLCTTK